MFPSLFRRSSSLEGVVGLWVRRSVPPSNPPQPGPGAMGSHRSCFSRRSLHVRREGGGLCGRARHEIVDTEMCARIGAGYGERSPCMSPISTDTDTTVGSYSASMLGPWRRSRQARLAVIQQAHVEGVLTTRIDELGKAVGMLWHLKSQVGRICSELGRRFTAL